MTEPPRADLLNQQIPLQEFLGILLRRRRLILLVFAAGLASAVGVAWTQLPVYRAAAKLRVSSERARIRVAPDGSANSAFDPINEATLSAEVALLRSVPLIREVLASARDRRNAPPPPPGPARRFANHVRSWLMWPLHSARQFYRRTHDIPELSGFDAEVAETAARVEVSVIEKSNLIHVAYSAGDPRWAAEFVNRLVTHHVERHVQLNQQSEALRFFEEQRERLSEQQRAAHAALAALSEREQIDSLPDQLARLRGLRTDVQADLGDADVQLVEANARAEFLRKAIGASYTGQAQGPESVPGGGASLVKSRILELELQRSQLLSQFTPESIKVRDVDRQLAEARRLLAAEADNPSGALAAVGGEDGSLELDLARTQAEIAAVQARIRALGAQAAEYQRAEEHLSALSAEYTRLEQNASRADAEYLNYAKAVDEAKRAQVLDDLGIVNLTIVERAEVPVAPLSSSQWRVVILGAVLSVAAGLGLAFARDHFDPSVKSAAQAERVSGLPVLVEIP